jgi:hypothetical protein
MNQTHDSFDELAKVIARAGGIGDKAAENIGSSPFLHARLRARIEAERARRMERRGWLPTLLIASRAVALLFVVTIAAALSFWFSRAGNAAAPVGKRVPDNITRIITGGTCALSTTDECAISTEEVLATLFAEDGGKEEK